MRDVHEEGWQEEMGEKWYRLAKEDFGQERYVKEFCNKGEVRVKFRLRWYQRDSWVTRRDVVRVKMVDVSYICDEDVEDSVHFLLHCGELLMIAEDFEGIEGTEEWMAEWRNVMMSNQWLG